MNKSASYQQFQSYKHFGSPSMGNNVKKRATPVQPLANLIDGYKNSYALPNNIMYQQAKPNKKNHFSDAVAPACQLENKSRQNSDYQEMKKLMKSYSGFQQIEAPTSTDDEKRPNSMIASKLQKILQTDSQITKQNRNQKVIDSKSQHECQLSKLPANTPNRNQSNKYGSLGNLKNRPDSGDRLDIGATLNHTQIQSFLQKFKGPASKNKLNCENESQIQKLYNSFKEITASKFSDIISQYRHIIKQVNGYNDHCLQRQENRVRQRN